MIESEDASDALAVAICHATRASTRARLEGAFTPMKWFLALLGCACLSARPMSPISISRNPSPEARPPSWPSTWTRAAQGDYREDEKDDNPVHFQLNDTGNRGACSIWQPKSATSTIPSSLP